MTTATTATTQVTEAVVPESSPAGAGGPDRLDVLTIGRCGIDIYPLQVGVGQVVHVEQRDRHRVKRGIAAVDPAGMLNPGVLLDPLPRPVAS